MIWYLYFIIFFGITGPFVASHNALTIQEFQFFQCSSICTDSAMNAHVKGICLQIETDLQDRYEDRTIKSLSQCKKETSVEFKEENTILERGYRREVGMCYLSDAIEKCITKGSKENSVYIYSYTDEVCRDPQEFDYNFSIPPFVGPFITPLQFIQWKCSIICKNPALQKHVIKICNQLSNEISEETRYETDQISARSGCKSDISVEFENDNGWIVAQGYKETVAMCYLSPEVTKCITKGPEDKSVFVFSYTNNVCHTPNQIDYDLGYISFPANEKKENAEGFLGIAQLLTSKTQVESTPAVKAEGNTATSETNQSPISSTSDFPIPTTEEGKPAIVETTKLPIPSTSVPGTPSTKEKKNSMITGIEKPPVSKPPIRQRKESTMSIEKPLQSSSTLTQSPLKKQKKGIICAAWDWIKSWF